MEEKTIYVAGLGLIGASLALGIKRGHPDYKVIGYNRSDKSREVALERGIVDEATSDFKEFAPLADIIILAVPIKQTIDFIKILANLDLKENVIITDAGSTKFEIVKAAEHYLKDKPIQFAGSHPMAGSHKSGAIAADVNLFENAYYIFSPSSLTKADTIPALQDLLSGLHARYVEIDAAEHDQVTSQISHFPHIIASSLMEQAGDFSESHEMTKHFAAGGFRDMTRIAESEPGMWTSILLTNSQAVLDRIENFKQRLDGISDLIKAKDEDAIWEFFNRGRQIRKNMEIHKRAGVDSFYDLYVDVPDEENVILEILELLRGTSLVNIRINEENREDINGILQISFKNERDLKRAEGLIRKHTNYRVYLN
ncbi:prephenate dehydrogenase [Streptococcus ratti]|uniref:Prephenate dehydrogenase n=1 Tax=Streptococcus ratti FA-1 = DSM 20564 TaxID=699248 RepID=A0ABN0GT86_STRRT|nr:prephenate dehydrogenase [Streptococcus ratti]EJN93628.1 prephenate dehydrogenase [Streptococcus ratti FA-1 = DSM 20564]EMP69774.1 prephenate dehydrogenase [Streptococcus ratti FA-1 = DSM 20564]QEY07496.1 prephenate dehydrogenase [Streptococcus ratti]VEI59946.1 prephenate dehydrogenase [Streptococcus mutans]